MDSWNHDFILSKQIAKDIKEQEKQMRNYNQEVGKLEKEKSDYEELLKERNEVLVTSAKDMAIEGERRGCEVWTMIRMYSADCY